MALVTCICPPKWDGRHRILCDHELADIELAQERYEEWWNE